ncbi:hypothetical protein KHO57_gp140 [Mycobacterium phage Phabba]|uniref:Uncharacterized protein n=1 Tax=Mycobacterium phage Phabba TaxID=2027899 RepID=A0A249XU50_9CAUD|nr:hypothetical protein KHO57_gp140 [Mycobacterium phage Phabba]ASZ74764.1 hypothetical protein SEA_PHABBA_227 [Mycobacterium phage Phabba]
MTRPTARSSDASVSRGTSTAGLSPLQWGDKCFLCGHTIAEGAGEGFYQSKKGGFLRCHRGCLTTMEVAGGHPKDFHRAMEERKKAPVHDKPVHQDVEQSKLQVAYDDDEAPPAYSGPRSIKFNDLQHLQEFIVQRGPLPSHVRVFIGDYVIQAGGGA